MSRPKLRVLLIEDDEDDFVLVEEMLREAEEPRFVLQWARTYEGALEAVSSGGFDLFLLDYMLGERNGLELLRELGRRAVDVPVILLTGRGGYEVDLEAMRSGASDYLVKGQFTGPLLARSIRYAIERKQVERELKGYRDHLEELVEQRTGELERANEQLRREAAERQRAEEARAESEQRSRIIVERAQDIIYSILPSGIIHSLNPAFESSTGWKIHEWVGKSFRPIIHPEDLPIMVMKFRSLLRTESSPPVELRLLTRAGDYKTFEFRTAPHVKDGRVVRLLGVARDVSERRRAEERMLKQNEFLNHVLESLSHPFFIVDAQTRKIVMANSAAVLSGAMRGMPCYGMHNLSEPCRDSDQLCPLRMIQESKRPVTVEHTHFDGEGNGKSVEVHAYPILNEWGEVAQVIEYCFDVTERKKMEEAMKSSSEKIKLFAYSISHDLKSPVVGIHGLTNLLHRQYGDLLDERGKKYCEQIVRASEQVVAMVDEINLFIKMKEVPLRFERVKLKEVIQMVREEFAAILESRSITWVEPEEVPDINADRISIVRVFRNLVDNALKYGGEGLSEIKIGYYESELYHTFSVSDNGVGIKREDSSRIFDLFQRYETSTGVEGTGLGLAIIKEILRLHRGRVWVEPSPEKGTTFYISISKRLKTLGKISP